MEGYLNRLNNVFHGIIALPLLVFIYLFLELDQGGNHPPPEFDYAVLYSAGFILAAVAYSLLLLRRVRSNLSHLDADLGLKEKLERFRKEAIRFYLLMMLPAIPVIAAMWLTGIKGLGLAYLLQLFLLSIHRPSPDIICKRLQLEGEERQVVIKKGSLSDLIERPRKQAESS